MKYEKYFASPLFIWLREYILFLIAQSCSTIKSLKGVSEMEYFDWDPSLEEEHVIEEEHVSHTFEHILFTFEVVKHKSSWNICSILNFGNTNSVISL